MFSLISWAHEQMTMALSKWLGDVMKPTHKQVDTYYYELG